MFCAMTAAAMRLCVSGKGRAQLAFLVAVALSLCLGQSGERITFSPTLFLSACVGTAYIGYKRDLRALVCVLAVAATDVCALSASSVTDATAWGYVCSAAFCALLLRPAGAGAAFVVGYVFGDTYSLFSDSSLVFRYSVYSLDIVFVAAFCVLASALVNAISDALDSGKDRALNPLLPALPV